jgi:C-terminal processing protease CtpA/Prc
MEGVLSLFTFGEPGGYLSRTRLEPLNLAGRDLSGSQTLPLVVLVSEATNSSGELFAGLLQERARAQIIGGTTRANVETLFAHDLPDGSQLWLAEERFVPLSGARWEETGIVPDLLIEQSWDGFVESADDEALRAALEALKP